MTVHPFPIKGDSSDVAGTRLVSAVPFGAPGWQRWRVLIRRPWVRAVVDPGVSDRDAVGVATARGEIVDRDRRAA
jgi:hypothetical protein